MRVQARQCSMTALNIFSRSLYWTSLIGLALLAHIKGKTPICKSCENRYLILPKSPKYREIVKALYLIADEPERQHNAMARVLSRVLALLGGLAAMGLALKVTY
jgi:hypothetical protein